MPTQPLATEPIPFPGQENLCSPPNHPLEAPGTLSQCVMQKRGQVEVSVCANPAVGWSPLTSWLCADPLPAFLDTIYQTDPEKTH